MFTAISALNLHQSYLDVVADNLANANTTGYKASRVLFQDQLAQIMNPGSAPSGNVGGTNPVQIGLGAQLGYISPVFTQGAMQNTGRSTDVAIEGDGLFVYDQGVDQRYSREGSLDLDSNGYLVNSGTGLRIQGWQGVNGVVNNTGPLGSIQIPVTATRAQATANAAIGGNLNASSVTGDVVDTTIATYDSQGNAQNVVFSFTKGTPAGTPPITPWAWTAKDAAGNTLTTGTISFDANGQSTGTTTAAVTIPGTAGAGAFTANVDLGKMTQLSEATSATETSQDGLAPGSFSSLYITPGSGEVYAVFTNGLKEKEGQLALARFNNPSGLLRAGSNLFQQGLNSGTPQIGTPDSGGRGLISSGNLEASNVDMSTEFTNMILAERGFQANSRVITTSDEILQELVNLKR
jgi:flagellar hook protein FlgE